MLYYFSYSILRLILNNNIWFIEKTKKIEKYLDLLPKNVKIMAYALFKDIEKEGPLQATWPNFSPLKGTGLTNAFHCHLKKGRPTYVACWRIADKKDKIIEVYYVGTHENAPY